jgi:hypothetical protein
MTTAIQTTQGRVESRNVHESVGLEINIEPHRRTEWERRLTKTWGTGDRGEWSHGICKGCGTEIDTTPTQIDVAGSQIPIPVTVCEPCMGLVRSHYATETQEAETVSKTPKWDEKCPERLMPVILGTIAPNSIDWPAYRQVKEWNVDANKGMALIGDQGSGKTTALWALFRELELVGINPILLNSVEMGRILGEAARDIKAVTWMYRCRVLMIDDLGKERASPGVASLLWEVLNERYNRNLPVIVSSRFRGDDFEKRFSEPHLGEDIRRRMNALCAPIRFTVQG